MALVASRSSNSGTRRLSSICAPSYPVKRRSFSRVLNETTTTVVTTISPPQQKPRTSWGKPHADQLSVWRSSPLFYVNQEVATSSSNTCNFDEKSLPTAASSCTSLPPHYEASTAFIKTEPLQHLAIKLEEEDYNDDSLLHQVPTFFPAGHLITTSNCSEAKELSHFAHIFPPLSSLSSWPISSVSSSSPGPSSDEFSGDDTTSWDQDFHEESCSFLSERFYEIERSMCSVIEGTLLQASDTDHIASSNRTMAVLVPGIDPAASLLVPKREEGSDCSPVAGPSCSTVWVGSFDTVTTAEVVDEGYRIDLLDFEAEHIREGSSADPQKPVLGGNSGVAKIALCLNYDEVKLAWSDQGSLFTDGNLCKTSADDYTLDLTAWGPEAHQQCYSQLLDQLVPEEGKMIAIAGPDVGDGWMGGSSVREARVMRYREKRRTRLFSKKIRYEVRKLNAERRPRMKGRFIKRT